MVRPYLGYAWDHFVDPRYGAWYRILRRDNRTYDDYKSPPGKIDYHTMGACDDVRRVCPAGGGGQSSRPSHPN